MSGIGVGKTLAASLVWGGRALGRQWHRLGWRDCGSRWERPSRWKVPLPLHELPHKLRC